MYMNNKIQTKQRTHNGLQKYQKSYLKKNIRYKDFKKHISESMMSNKTRLYGQYSYSTRTMMINTVCAVAMEYSSEALLQYV